MSRVRRSSVLEEAWELSAEHRRKTALGNTDILWGNSHDTNELKKVQ
jgi:hypothetical protein